MASLSPYHFIAIEGNIGAGKTSLARKIAENFNAKLVLEQFEDNPFLPKFYQDPEKYAFPLELSFLAARYQQLSEELLHQDLFKSFTISDYFIHKSLIFARRTLGSDEFVLYQKLFNIMMKSLPKPGLLVYLHMNVGRLMENIHQRGRTYEQRITPAYLGAIQEGYFEHLKTILGMRILFLDINRVDFVSNPGHYHTLVDLMFRDYDAGIHRLELS